MELYVLYKSIVKMLSIKEAEKSRLIIELISLTYSMVVDKLISSEKVDDNKKKELKRIVEENENNQDLLKKVSQSIKEISQDIRDVALSQSMNDVLEIHIRKWQKEGTLSVDDLKRLEEEYQKTLVSIKKSQDLRHTINSGEQDSTSISDILSKIAEK